MRIITRIIAVLLLATPLLASAGDKPSIAVLDFNNDTNAGWWYSGAGSELAGMLTNELASGKQFKVVERQQLGAVLGEQDLGASGRVRSETAAQIGQMTGAQYLVTATVSAYEHDVKDSRGGLSYKGFSIGGKKEDAYLAVDLRVIDASTGEVYDTRTVEGRAGSTGVSLRGYKNGFGGQLGQENKTPTGKAIRAAIFEIVGYLECSIITPSGRCMREYDAKEDKRRDSLRDSISLD